MKSKIDDSIMPCECKCEGEIYALVEIDHNILVYTEDQLRGMELEAKHG